MSGKKFLSIKCKTLSQKYSARIRLKNLPRGNLFPGQATLGSLEKFTVCGRIIIYENVVMVCTKQIFTPVEFEW